MTGDERFQQQKDQIRESLLKYTRKAFGMLPQMDRPRILDIGCGSGIPTMELAKLSQGEITGIDHMARRAAGFSDGLMHAEVVDGMDVLAVADSVSRARKLIAKGGGPVLIEFMTYRYKGHSLSDPLT